MAVRMAAAICDTTIFRFLAFLHFLVDKFLSDQSLRDETDDR